MWSGLSPRLSNLREHMVSAHGADKARHTGFEYIVNADAVKNAAGTTTGSQNTYTGRYDYVMKDLMSITNGGQLSMMIVTVRMPVRKFVWILVPL
ncbi:hypothetical protein DOY81_013072 [Sarcophaga bullata]|nr:hypothetical protein DOY81_013072 [Sarcophaga bullata]